MLAFSHPVIKCHVLIMIDHDHWSFPLYFSFISFSRSLAALLVDSVIWRCTGKYSVAHWDSCCRFSWGFHLLYCSGTFIFSWNTTILFHSSFILETKMMKLKLITLSRQFWAVKAREVRTMIKVLIKNPRWTKNEQEQRSVRRRQIGDLKIRAQFS